MRLKQFLKYNAKTVFFNVMKTQFVIAGGIYVIVFFFSILINTGENNGMHASFSNMFNIILFVSGLAMFNMIYDEIYKVSVANSVSRLTTVAATIVTALGSSLFTALLISICERFMCFLTEFYAFLRYNSGSWLEVFDEGFFNTLVLKDDYNSYIVQMSFFDFLREVGVIVFALMSIALFIFAFLTAKRRINKLAGMILNVALGGLIFYLLFNIDNIADKVYDIYEVWINDAYMYKVELSVLGIVSLIVYYSLFKKITHERAVTEQT